MENLLSLVSDNTLIEGVKKVSDKVYKFKAIYDRAYIEVKKYEVVNIISGLETVVCYTKEDQYDYFEVIETTTGTVVSYQPLQNRDMEEAKKIAIEKAEKLLNELAEQWKLVDVLTKVSAHITKGISPSYEGIIEDKNDRSNELKNMGIGDRLLFINLRGGLHYYTAVIDSMKTVTRCNKEVIEYKLITDKTGHYFYKVFDDMGKNSAFYYEPEFVEMLEKASSISNLQIETENTGDEEVVTTKNVEAPVNKDVISPVEETELSKTMKEHLTPANVSDKKYQEYVDIVSSKSLINKDKEVPSSILEIDKKLEDGGFIRTYNDMLNSSNYHIVYFKHLDNLKKYFRLQVNNIITEGEERHLYRLGIAAAKFQTEYLVSRGDISQLESVLAELSIILGEDNNEAQLSAETTTELPVVEQTTEIDKVNVEIVDTVDNDVETVDVEIIEEEEETEDDCVVEIAKSPYKTILLQYEGSKNMMEYSLHDVKVSEDKESLSFIYKYDENEAESSPIIKSQLEDDPTLKAMVERTPNCLTRESSIREIELKIARTIFELFDESKVYTLEELVRKGISLNATPVKTEDLTILSDLEFYNKQNYIWDVLHSSERFYRWGKPQASDQLIIKGYNEVILHSIFDLLHRDSMRRGRLAAINMDEETAKGHALKWIYTDRYQEMINSGDKAKLEKSLKHEYYVGTLCGEYGFFIGQVTCNPKGATISLYGDMKNYCNEKYKMSYKEIADRLIKKYQVKEITEDIELVKAKPVEVEKARVTNPENPKQEELTLFTLTEEDIKKLSTTVKKTRNKNKLIEGQMTLFAI